MLVAAPNANIEAESDNYLEVELFEFREGRRPAQHSEVRLITEADYDLFDCVPFMVRDLPWLEDEQGDEVEVEVEVGEPELPPRRSE